MIDDPFETSDIFYDFYHPKSRDDQEFLLEAYNDRLNLFDYLTTDRGRSDGLLNTYRQNISRARYLTYGQSFDFGPQVFPPANHKSPGSDGFTKIVWWYNDFGLEHSNVPDEANGSYVWYDGRWNDPSSDSPWPYDPQRETTLGPSFKGDQPEVLDWILRFNLEAGINVISPVMADDGFSSANWTQPTDKNYWVYRLLHDTPNAKSIRYLLWGRNIGTTAEVEANQNQILAVDEQYPGAWVWQENGKSYFAIFYWDMEQIRGIYDGFEGTDTTNMTAMFVDFSNRCKSAGYDGAFVMCRNGGVLMANLPPELAENDCIMMNAGYDAFYFLLDEEDHEIQWDDYEDYVTNTTFPTALNTIPNICTAGKTKAPHPSSYDMSGTTPELFRFGLSRLYESIIKNNQRRIYTINNMSELGELGPGLIPNIVDGPGYLDAIKSMAPRDPETILFSTGIGEWELIPATEFNTIDGVSGAVANVVGNIWQGWQVRHSNSDYITSIWRVPPDWETVDIYVFWSKDGTGSGDVTFFNWLDPGSQGSLLTTEDSDPTEGTGTAIEQNVANYTKIAADKEVTGNEVVSVRVERSGFSPSDTLTDTITIHGVYIVRKT